MKRAGSDLCSEHHPSGEHVFFVETRSGSLLLVGTNDGRLQALAASDGSVLWQRETGHSFGGPALVQVGETIYAATRDGRLYALRARDGTIIWESGIPAISQTFDDSQVRVFASATCIALQYGKRIIAVDPANGIPLWEYVLPTTTYQGWVVALGVSHAYIVEQRFTTPITWSTSARAIRDGTVQWSTTEHVTLEPSGDAGSSLVEADGVVYAYGFGLHALDSQTGSLLWEQKATP